ncbi:hypothetical protein B0A55_06221 [Friedmanniomyces simplex]|uniref:Uncharacterized protein n=1 Tax=Friedmanniomyces simplex TaxID=329884 RepID=A0A4U0X7S0_9PEZI|nr:hypothetical protein B0A55_06221 [Friedmanniomyces simplex]
MALLTKPELWERPQADRKPRTSIEQTSQQTFSALRPQRERLHSKSVQGAEGSRMQDAEASAKRQDG